MKQLLVLLRQPRVAATLLAILLAAAGVTGVTISVDGGKAPAPTPTLKQAPVTVAEGGADLRAEPFVDDALRATRQIAPQTQRPDNLRLGPTCKVDYSGHVYSDRLAGVVPTQFVLHYTVSSNRPGWDDVFAIQNYFKANMNASAHFILDFEGHCLKMVPLTKKAWTQGSANSWSYSVEIIATGNESAAQWKAAPIIKNKILAGLVARVMKYEHLPLRQIDPPGCDFSRTGYTDHNHLECGNDHHDVSPHFPWRVFRAQLATFARKAHEFPLAG